MTKSSGRSTHPRKGIRCSGDRGHGRNGVKVERVEVGPISTTFESRPGGLSRLVQNADRVDGAEIGCGRGGAGITGAAAGGDSDLLEHTRLFAKFFEARVFF